MTRYYIRFSETHKRFAVAAKQVAKEHGAIIDTIDSRGMSIVVENDWAFYRTMIRRGLSHMVEK